MVRTLLLFSLLFLVSVACAGPEAPVSDTPEILPPQQTNFMPIDNQDGQEGQPCGMNGECDEGLTCVSNLCVNLASLGDSEDDVDEGDDNAPDGTSDDGRDDGTNEPPDDETADDAGVPAVADPDDISDDDEDDPDLPVNDPPSADGGVADVDDTPTAVIEGSPCDTDLEHWFGQGSCEEGLVCIPGNIVGAGVCRKSCESVGEDDLPAEDAAVCTDALTCQTLYPNTLSGYQDGLIAGNYAMVCLEQVEDLQTPCHALYDTDACAHGRDCQIVDYYTVYAPDGTLADLMFNELRCRETCSFDDFGTCSGTDSCLSSEDPIMGFDIEWEGDDPTTEVYEAYICEKEACDDDDLSTWCSCDAAYECLATTDGFAHCGRFVSTGWCASPVDLFNTDDWSAAQALGWPEDKMCDEIHENRLCDDQLFRDDSVDATLACVGVSNTSTMGICMAFCEVPADPSDPTEMDFFGTCPSGYECSQDLAVAMVFGPWTDGTSHVLSRDEALTCNSLTCPEGTECSACGMPGAQCGVIPIDAFGNTFSGCFVPYSFCQMGNQ